MVGERGLVKIVSSEFDLESWLAAGLLREASFWCPPQPGASVTLHVFAGNSGLAESIIICFLNMLHAHINVGSHKGKEYASLKLLASEIIKSLLSMWKHHIIFMFVPKACSLSFLGFISPFTQSLIKF